VGVISELVNEDGSMMRSVALHEFAKSHDIPMITIAELAENLSELTKSGSKDLRWASLPRSGGVWQIATHVGRGGIENVVMRYGDIEKPNLLIRVHSECLTGDVLSSLRCDCGNQLQVAMQEIEGEGNGLLIYLRDHEGRGIGLSEKIRAYQLQDRGLDTVDANLALGHEVDERDFADAVEILKDLGVTQVRILTNNPSKVETLNKSGIHASARALNTIPNNYNAGYLKAKQERLGHNLEEASDVR
jgi:3,4-dihydroxy 2-butanone 4-phosphate synthase/GTP cyclohydrolase II